MAFKFVGVYQGRDQLSSLLPEKTQLHFVATLHKRVHEWKGVLINNHMWFNHLTTGSHGNSYSLMQSPFNAAVNVYCIEIADQQALLY